MSVQDVPREATRRASGYSRARSSGSWLEEAPGSVKSFSSLPSFHLGQLGKLLAPPASVAQYSASEADTEERFSTRRGRVAPAPTVVSLESDRQSVSISQWARSVDETETGDTIWKVAQTKMEASSFYGDGEDPWLPKSRWARLDKRWKRLIYAIIALSLLVGVVVLVVLLVKKLDRHDDDATESDAQSSASSAVPSNVVITRTLNAPTTLVVVGTSTYFGDAALSVLGSQSAVAAAASATAHRKPPTRFA